MPYPSTPSMIRACAAAALLGLVWVLPAGAADPLRPFKTPTPPVIDGDLADAVWQSAPTVTGFKTWMPDYGKDMPDQTVVYYAYDAENLYFAFRAFDSEPGRIKASIAARDGITADDWVCINLDSFGDQQSLYGLYVNPLGIQGDSRYAAGREDFGFDAVWYSAGRIDDQGYTIEVRIPFKSLRYGDANPVRMALIFERRVSGAPSMAPIRRSTRRSGRTSSPRTSRSSSPTSGTTSSSRSCPTRSTTTRCERVAESLERASSGPEFGLTAKYGVTAQLVFDGAVNPDFSQVEADAGQIDINRRYALFFPEKRPFFLEGRDSFNFAGAGLQPDAVRGAHADDREPDCRRQAHGQAGRRRTPSPPSTPSTSSPTRPSTAGSPDYAQVAVAALQARAEGRLVPGRLLHRPGRRATRSTASYGGDGSLRVTQAGALGFYAFGSSTRPLGEDTTGGHSVLANYTHDNRKMSLYLQALDISQGFDTWTGYLTRAGVFQASASLTPRFYPKSTVVRRVEPNVIVDYVRDAESGLWEQWYEGGLSLVLPRSGRIVAKYHASNEVFEQESFDTSGLQILAGVATDESSCSLQGTFAHQNAIYYSADPFPGTSTSAVARAALSALGAVALRSARNLLGLLAGPATAGASTTTASTAPRRPTSGTATCSSAGSASTTAIGASCSRTSWRRSPTSPGTVFHVGYGSLYEKVQWQDDRFVPGRDLLETRRGFFLKLSYLWRL